MLKWFKKKKEDSPETAATEQPGGSKGFFARLKERLGKTQQLLVDGLRAAVGLRTKVDDEMLDEIEEILIRADVGAKSAARIVDDLRKRSRTLETVTPDAVMDLVKASITSMLEVAQAPLEFKGGPPHIILVCGVNGTGKTTTIGKLALELSNAGKTVMLVAADTFRAGAVHQLEIWADRVGAAFVRKDEGADPASVVYEALDAAKQDPPDVILIDTAGRLHTKTYLMNELSKVIRTVKKLYPDAPHETILVLDATTGQNGLMQVKTFREVAAITGIIMTKLDGTAKGGILVAFKEICPLPIYKIGIGEAPEDLRDFKPGEFTDALFAADGAGAKSE